MTVFNIHRAKDQVTLAQLTSEYVSKTIIAELKTKERFQIALSGGSTPCMAYSLLREENLPWNLVDVVLGDERWVSHQDESSNALMLRRTLMASGPGAKACFHPIPTTELNTPEDSVSEFSKVINHLCEGDPPRFDLILLGLGEDGHTASLFPNSQSLYVKGAYATIGQGKGQQRISLTAEVLCSAAKVIFLVSGESKQIALKRLLDPLESFERTPARLVKPDSEVIIFTDEAAAKLI
ncbi:MULTISPECIES: 6-phosphogluconolactonase [Prochlorococcus]|uniref:6-phosphogluconolactonase n=1 Tax=Prochlorococcus marinus (strain SARG / CCMP1375 / SS120) TaxID=167539 RepID=Q7VC98_PROMA|nr:MULTISPECIES: 6-phosphogluconolactonase [Prochlorococcus]AAP99888.1 6-phosphogluconolactonase [Prochlorococcus marinus subsp. marinus str. CCMP1375]KGG11765.1 6-phosphogluconolactonase [Prochlorococcus marinus str. LG]KGG18821.1 6-phosphogluconolactonase [Prochlorococcus marinus str. SS2]KGG23641.1 6-phosphogluconolactonase [Prochlorococcus marinus str. SS35]KGG32123.1 6-phosphogluconolactonase [Prochlorococcus marinus str. SS51]